MCFRAARALVGFSGVNVPCTTTHARSDSTAREGKCSNKFQNVQAGVYKLCHKRPLQAFSAQTLIQLWAGQV